MSLRSSSSVRPSPAVRTMKPPGMPVRCVCRIFFSRSALFFAGDLARHADVIDGRHVDQEAAGQGDVRSDARALLTQRLLGNLNDNLLAFLQQIGDGWLTSFRAFRTLSTLGTFAALGTLAAFRPIGTLRALAAFGTIAPLGAIRTGFPAHFCLRRTSAFGLRTSGFTPAFTTALAAAALPAIATGTAAHAAGGALLLQIARALTLFAQSRGQAGGNAGRLGAFALNRGRFALGPLFRFALRFGFGFAFRLCGFVFRLGQGFGGSEQIDVGVFVENFGKSHFGAGFVFGLWLRFRSGFVGGCMSGPGSSHGGGQFGPRFRFRLSRQFGGTGYVGLYMHRFNCGGHRRLRHWLRLDSQRVIFGLGFARRELGLVPLLIGIDLFHDGGGDDLGFRTLGGFVLEFRTFVFHRAAVLGQALAGQNQDVFRRTGSGNRFGRFGPGSFGRGLRTGFGTAPAFGARRIEFGIGQTSPTASLRTFLSTATPATAATAVTIPAIATIPIAFAAFDAARGHQLRRGRGSLAGGGDCFGGRAFHRSGGGYGRVHNDTRHGVGVAIELQNLFFNAGDDLVVLFVVFEKVGNVKEGVAVQPDIDECRLHAGQHAGDSSFVNAASERIFVLALMIDLSYEVVFDNCHPGFMAARANY